uniref:Protein kinase domain-containing protein n=1 Tax=Musa acuminata subsp. malaccensis TaxID=214687 RepID=A0A804II42_MUSAM
MHPSLRSPLPSILLLLALSSTPPSSSESYYRYADCAPYTYSCGGTKINISYPFRVDSRADYCGYPGYYVACSKNNTSMTIEIDGKGYVVKDIDYLNRLITVVDPPFVNQSCPQPYQNTSLDISLYSYSDRDVNVTVFVNCTALSPPIPDVHDMGCATGGRHGFYQLTDENHIEMFENCSSMVVVPIHQAAAVEIGYGKRSFSDAVKGGFSLRWEAGEGWCRDCVESGGRCGFDVLSQESHTCFCPHNSTVGTCSPSNKGSVIGGISLLCLFLRVIYALRFRKSPDVGAFDRQNCCIPCRRRSCGNSAQGVEAFLRQCGILAPKRYRYSEIKRMTKSFDDKLGQGGFGSVFKGALQDGRLVAVKVLKATKGHGGEEFINEVASISRTSHVNIVGLLGFCLEGSKRALVYDFMPNGSLEKFICSDKSTEEPRFGCEKLFEIALGVARGLEYLHGGCSTRIVHFDIKPHNILLDQDFCPKISDFGLAKLCPPKVSVISMADARGTVGYIAPEVFSRGFGVVSSKSDVYSYGMLLLEMAGGRRSIGATDENTSEVYFPHCLYDDLDRYCNVGAAGVTTETREVARKMMIVGLWCIQMMPENRPSMSEVVEMLKGSATDLRMPPRP